MVALAIAAYAVYQFSVIRRQEKVAEGFFYAMKLLDVQFAEVEQQLAKSGNAPEGQAVARYMAQRREIEHNYEGCRKTLRSEAEREGPAHPARDAHLWRMRSGGAAGLPP